MKKLAAFLVLASSLVFVGCNPVTNVIATTYLDEILGISKGIDGSAGFCTEWYREKCKDWISLNDLLIVEETADGENRVILKQWSKLISGNGISGIGGGWLYYGVDFSADDYNAWLGLASDADKVQALVDRLAAGFEKYGYLKFEPADSQFFFKNSDGNYELFSETVASVKDLELMGAKVEDNNAIALGGQLSAQYGLSNERGQVVAKTIAAYNKLASKRSLTSVEKNQFSTGLLGVDYKTAERSIKGGDANEFQALMEQAARTNGTTPEAVSAIIKDMVL